MIYAPIDSASGRVVLLRANERVESVSDMSLMLMQIAAIVSAFSLGDRIHPAFSTAPLLGAFLGALINHSRFSRWRGDHFNSVATHVVIGLVTNFLFFTAFASSHYSESDAFGMLPMSAVSCIALFNLFLYRVTPNRLGMMAAIIFVILLVHLAIGQSLLRSVGVGAIFILVWMALACRRIPAIRNSGWKKLSTLKYGLRTTFVTLLISLPMVATFFVLFPRLPIDALRGEKMERPRTGKTGLSDSLTLGSISELNKSTEPAFKASFKNSTPRDLELYWRAVVLDRLDGVTWRSAQKSSDIEPVGSILKPTTTAYPYQSEWDESNYSNQIVVLDGTYGRIFANFGNQSIGINALPDESYTAPSSLLGPQAQRLSTINAIAYERHNSNTLSQEDRAQSLALPAEFNPRTQAKGRDLRNKFVSDQRIIDEVLRSINQDPYRYTLRPPTLGEQSIDDFFFRTRAGFCEHYASAFVVLMRSAGIPARLVTGYLSSGAQKGSVSVSQGDAHAWTEVWLEGRGWVRQDPTASISPSRVDPDASNARLNSAPNGIMGFLEVTWRNNTFAAENIWRDAMLGFDAQRQEEIFRKLGLEDAAKPLLGLAAIVFMALVALVWQHLKSALGLRTIANQGDVAAELLSKRCKRIGLERRPGETWRSVVLRSRSFMHEADVQALGEIVVAYENLYYARSGSPGKAELKELLRRIKTFDPKAIGIAKITSVDLMAS